MIERHDDIGTERLFDFNRRFGRDEMRRAVDVRLKRHALVSDLAEFRQTENLKPAAVGQNRTRPSGKGVQPAQFRHDLMPGA